MEENRYYVYVHKDKTGNIVYIGHGTGNRFKQKSGRIDRHKEIFDELTYEVVQDKLTKNKAIELENELLSSFTGELFNVKKNSMPTKEVDYQTLKNYFIIDPSSPSGLSWLVDIKSWDGHKSQVKAGQCAGTKTKQGYWDVHLNDRCYKVHRIVWALYNQCNTPTNKIIDHINRDRSDNSPENLRLATQHSNSRNASVRKNNTSGVIGVCWGVDKRNRGYWSAMWRDNNKSYSKKFYPQYLFKGFSEEDAKALTLQIAKEFRENKMKELFGEDYRG